MMERLHYWLSNVLGRQDNYCRSCCISCRFYEICRADKTDEDINQETE